MREEIYNRMDWKMLRRQKEELYKVALNGHPNLHGIVHLIDEIQDYAVNCLGFPEEEVFNFK